MADAEDDLDAMLEDSMLEDINVTGANGTVSTVNKSTPWDTEADTVVETVPNVDGLAPHEGVSSSVNGADSTLDEDMVSAGSYNLLVGSPPGDELVGASWDNSALDGGPDSDASGGQ
ncbi:hypothetical protein BJX70DRAFT_404873 [Aspergillus crustosus]